MKIPERDTAVFTTSAIDLFASALGAFILLVMLLFPYYRHAGPDDAFSKTRDFMEQRRQASNQNNDRKAELDMLQSELDRLTGASQEMEQYIRLRELELADIRNQLAQLPVTLPEPIDIITPETPPLALTEGVEFSILGLASDSKSFIIVIDMSGSMMDYESLMTRSVLEILDQLDESNRFSIIGYQGNPQPTLWRFPNDKKLLPGTAENLRLANIFVNSLSRNFVGSTPTHFALQAALEYPSSAIILMSDGEPNTPPGYIIENITRLNQIRQTEIHTVAIGNYTYNRNLVLFLQTLSRINNGEFVGVSR